MLLIDELLGRNMHKNALFLLENCKTPLPTGLRTQTSNNPSTQMKISDYATDSTIIYESYKILCKRSCKSL